VFVESPTFRRVHHLQSAAYHLLPLVSYLAYSSNLKAEGVGSSKTSVFLRPTRRRNQEVCNLLTTLFPIFSPFVPG
jgi:hypothetical protein